jgi:hypothetical protein
MQNLSNVLDEIDRRKNDVDASVLEVSSPEYVDTRKFMAEQDTRLAHSMTQLSQLAEIPFEDGHRRIAERIADFWGWSQNITCDM